MDAQHDVAAVEVLLHLAHLDVDVVADGDRRFHHASTDADVAGSRKGALERLLDPLAGDGDQAEVVELKHLRRSAVALELFFEAGSLADELARVDVDRDQGFGLVDDDRAAGLEPDLGTQGLVDLFGDAELLEEWGLLGVELDAADERRLEALQEAQDALVLGLGVDPDGGEVVGDLIAQDALDQIEI